MHPLRRICAFAAGAALLSACDGSRTTRQEGMHTESKTVNASLNLAKLTAAVTDGLESMSAWEDEGVSCAATNVSDHELQELVIGDDDRIRAAWVAVSADIPFPYCGGNGGTRPGQCWVYVDMSGGKLEAVDYECVAGDE